MGTPNSSPSKRNQISKKEKAGEETKKTYTERKSSRSKRLLRHETLSNVDKKQYRREMKKKKKKYVKTVKDRVVLFSICRLNRAPLKRMEKSKNCFSMG